ncbi:hypothetical protein LXL04_015507 [Taraxacum kok-saghyz]
MGQMLTVIEYALLLYRAFLRAPVWYRFFLNKEYGSLFSSLTKGLYLTFKHTSIVEKVGSFWTSLKALLRKEVHYGSYATPRTMLANLFRGRNLRPSSSSRGSFKSHPKVPIGHHREPEREIRTERSESRLAGIDERGESMEAGATIAGSKNLASQRCNHRRQSSGKFLTSSLFIESLFPLSGVGREMEIEKDGGARCWKGNDVIRFWFLFQFSLTFVDRSVRLARC